MNRVHTVQVDLYVEHPNEAGLVVPDECIAGCLQWCAVPNVGEDLHWDGTPYKVKSRHWGHTVTGEGKCLGNLCVNLILTVDDSE